MGMLGVTFPCAPHCLFEVSTVSPVSFSFCNPPPDARVASAAFQISAMEKEYEAAQELVSEEVAAASAAAESAESALFEAQEELENLRKKAGQGEERLRKAEEAAAAALADSREWRQQAEEARKAEAKALREAEEAKGARGPSLFIFHLSKQDVGAGGVVIDRQPAPPPPACILPRRNC